MKKILIGVFLSGLSLFFVACAQPSSEYTSNASNSNIAEDADYTSENYQVAKSEEGSGGGGDQKTGQAVANPQISLEEAEKSSQEETPKAIGRKIIRNAEMRLESSKPEETQQKITSIADSKNGFVINSTQRSTNAKVGSHDSVEMTIRVPAEKFEESVGEIRKTAERVVVETLTGQDVTEEFVDIQARLKAKKALEERFLEIMKQAKTVEESLEVERQLSEVRTEIERIEGRKRFLENQTSLSTIKVEIGTPAAISSSSNGFGYELKEAFSDGFEAALTFILFLIRIVLAVLPFLILIVLPILLVLRYFWRKRNQKLEVKENLDVE